ncbi:MAG: LytR C-terminal domain-containing protein [Actinomycetota bacterium]
MSNEESAAAYAATRRNPRQGASPSPVGSTLSIILAVIAVVAGFLILQNLTDDGGSAAVGSPGGVPGDDATGVDSTETTLPEVDIEVTPTTPSTTTTTVPIITTGATVVVANANTVGGSAGAMSKSLELELFTLGDPVNATGPNLQDSIVYYDPGVAGALDVANSVAFVLGGLSVQEVPTPVPTDSGSLGDAGVLLLLGDNEAGKTVEELRAAAESAAPADAPAVSGSDATTDDAASTTAVPLDE